MRAKSLEEIRLQKELDRVERLYEGERTDNRKLAALYETLQDNYHKLASFKMRKVIELITNKV